MSRFSEVERLSNETQGLEQRLKQYPELRAKIEAMLDIMENSGGDVEKAAEAERRIIEEMRPMGNEVLHGWARRQQQKQEEEFNAKPGVNRKGKNALLVHAAGEDRDSRGDLYARPAGARDPAVFGIGRGPVPWLLGSAGTGDDGFWCRRSLCGSVGEVERALWD
jgi:hypothetical protein